MTAHKRYRNGRLGDLTIFGAHKYNQNFRRKDKVCLVSPAVKSSFTPRFPQPEGKMSNVLVSLPLPQREPLRICTDIPLFTRCSSPSSSSSPSSANRGITASATTPSNSHHCFLYVLCMHDFESSDTAHLPFQKDEVLIIIQQECTGWWAAMRPQGDRIGWIPSSFVVPLDRRKFAEYPGETPFENLIDSPLSAVHDPWVPVSEDYRFLSFQIVSPTDHALYKGFFDDGMQGHSYELFLHLSNGERRSDMGDVCVPPIPDSPFPHMTQKLPSPPSPLLQEPGAFYSVRPANRSLADAGSCHHPHLWETDDQIPFLGLTTTAESDAFVPGLISHMNVEESLNIFKSVATSEDDTYSEDSLYQHTRLPAGFHSNTT